MKRIITLMVAALVSLSFSMVAVASNHKKEEAAPVAPAEKAEKAEKKTEKKPVKKDAKPAKKGKKEMAGC